MLLMPFSALMPALNHSMYLLGVYRQFIDFIEFSWHFFFLFLTERYRLMRSFIELLGFAKNRFSHKELKSIIMQVLSELERW